ncbi:MAG: DUF2029 domain-containing protein [Planctomycetes bacterium]|nr:DUF2029 domain-containing protein [Planctomycetota bacterium]
MTAPGPEQRPVFAAHPEVIRLATAGLLLLALAMAAKGVWSTWMIGGEIDMDARYVEYSSFRRGIYPNRFVEKEIPADFKVPYSVYPPYSLAMFAMFFEPFGRIQGRLFIQLTSLVALVAIGAYGRHLLRDGGPAVAALGAVAAAAISGNSNAIALGQSSIMLCGAVLMQIIALERGRPIAAGAWWALAMLKPQMGLPFIVLFLVRREWRGLATGIGILAGLSLGACLWTGISPLAIAKYWLAKMGMRFVDTTSLADTLASALGVPARWFHLSFAALMVAIPVLIPRRLLDSVRAEPLFAAAIAAPIGRLVLYHRFYDNVMLFPLMFAMLTSVVARPSTRSLALAVAMGLSLWVPQVLVERLPSGEMLRVVVWIICTLALLREQVPSPSPADRGATSRHEA